MRLTTNTFEKALDTYTDEQKVDPQSYIEAHNITLTSERKFFGPTNIQGTLHLTTASGTITNLTDANLKTVFAKFKIGTDSDVPCLVHFIAGTAASDHVIHITCQRLSDNHIFYLYAASYPSNDYFADNRLFDTRLYPENGVDYIYFTDFFNELRQLRCEIPTGAADNFLTDYDLSLQRRGANGSVTLNSINSGGSLLSGTYQYAYRMADPTNKKYTKWSSLCNPIHVYNSANSTAPVYSSVGLTTDFYIRLTITPSPEEAAHFTHYQLAVVENVYGVTTPVQPASLLPITSFTGTSVTFDHKANQKVGNIPITDIVVDLAAIKAVKTIAIKQNRLFAGNIEYNALDFESDPVATGSITASTTTDNDPYSNHTFSSTKLGYFRDETYRFGIVYKDKYGNRSPVTVLDLNGITNNQISGSLPDVKFPNRTNNSFSLMDSSSKVRILGLNLAVSNHPTWAVGFEIVRAKRKKKILFQTPVIPMTYVEGVGALGTYPSQSYNSSGAVPDPNAQPQKQDRIYTPKNLFWPELRAIFRRATDNSGTGADFAGIGEAQLFILPDTGQPNYSVIFPPSSIYGPSQYQFDKSERVETIDYAISKCWITDLDTTSHPTSTGEYLATQVSGVWYSLDQGDYYFDSAQVGKSVFEDPTHIKDAAYIENVSPGLVMGGNKIMTYSDLSGTVDWGFQQQPQRCVVIETAGKLPDVILNTQATLSTNPTGPLTFANGVLNAYTNTYIVGSSGPQYESTTAISNKFVNNYSGYTDHSSYTQAFRIANVVNDLGDDRYGDVDTQHEFISTGASYTFNSSELTNVQAGTTVNAAVTVYGGDCFIAPHTFKINDTWYSVTNQGKNKGTPAGDTDTNLVKYWGRHYTNIAVSESLCIPVALQGASQFIELILESEYNGSVVGEDILWAVTTVNDFPAMNLNDDFNTSGSLRSPLIYSYNLNLSKQNDQKVYFPLPAFSNVQYNYPARIAYSDLKIYGSDVQGFDVFRVGNTYDLEESRRAITKLSVAGDDLYAIQEAGILYVPTAQNQIQQTDAGTLAVGTGDVIGRPIVLQQNRGSIHLRGIAETGDTIFVPDSKNKTIYKLAGQQLATIDMANTMMNNSPTESQVVGFYDQKKHEYLLANEVDNTCYVYNEFINTGAWIGDYEFNGSGAILKDGLWCNDKFYVISTNSGTVDSWEMYAGNMNSLLGHTVTPRLKFVVSPDDNLAKTFDDMMLQSDQRLNQASFTVPRETSLGDQTNNTSLDSLSVEGGYRIKTPRDGVGARMRGSMMIAEVDWKTGTADKATLSAVLTKYRLSARTPF